MGCYQHNMKWEEFISVQLFCRSFASESISQIQIWHELIYPKIHNENKHLQIHAKDDCCLQKSSHWHRFVFTVCSKVGVCWSTQLFQDKEWESDAWPRMVLADEVRSNVRKSLLHAHTASSHQDPCLGLWKIKKGNHKWKNASLELFWKAMLGLSLRNFVLCYRKNNESSLKAANWLGWDCVTLSIYFIVSKQRKDAVVIEVTGQSRETPCLNSNLKMPFSLMFHFCTTPSEDFSFPLKSCSVQKERLV